MAKFKLEDMGLMGRVQRIERAVSLRFEKGQHVRTTQKALRNGVFEAHKTGVVVNYPAKGHGVYFVTVKVHPNKKPSIFHCSFWE